jgi:NADH dehydrogenase/NADH:ubiquinone oxidoreductase subunit G
MARKPTDTTPEAHLVTDTDTPGLPAMAEAANQVAAADTVILGAAETLKAVGRIEAFHFSATVAEKAIVETFVKIRETKQYKGLPYIDENGNSATVATLDEFCEAYLKKSYRRCKELADNYNILGPQLYEQAERIGLRQRDYNAIKALPADDQEIIKQALAEESKDRVLEVLQDMAVKHAKEKEALAKKSEEALGERDAARRVGEDKQAQINRLREELDEAREKRAHRTPNAKLQQHRQRVADTAQILEIDIAALRARMIELSALGQELGEDQTAFMAGTLGQSLARLADVRHALELPEVAAGPAMPEWLKDDSWMNAGSDPAAPSEAEGAPLSEVEG